MTYGTLKFLYYIFLILLLCSVKMYWGASKTVGEDVILSSGYLYQIVTQNNLRMCEGGQVEKNCCRFKQMP